MNRHRFKSDMEAAWELRPQTDLTPGSLSHNNRFASGKPKTGENKSKQAISEENTGGKPREKL